MADAGRFKFKNKAELEEKIQTVSYLCGGNGTRQETYLSEGKIEACNLFLEIGSRQ